MDRTRLVLEWDVTTRQEDIKFGCKPDGFTTDLEADETNVQHWSQEELVDGVRTTVWYWLIYVGVLERGSPQKFWLTPITPLPTSTGQYAKMPKMKNQFWIDICNRLFTQETKGILMSDSLPAYVEVGHPGLVQRLHVNHSEMEMSRSCDVLANTLDNSYRPGIAASQAVDQEWRRLLEHVPAGISCKIEKGMRRMALHIRTQQWFRWLRNRDRWGPFCEALQRWKAHRSTSAAAPLSDQDLQGKLGDDEEDAAPEDDFEELLHICSNFNPGDFQKLEAAMSAAKEKMAKEGSFLLKGMFF